MQITDTVFQLEAARYSHVFFIRSDENLLIDTSLPGSAGAILAELRRLGAAPDSIRAILLTHHDVDHIGNAKRLQEATGAALWAPGEDIPYITGEKSRPGLKRVIGAVARTGKPVLAGPYAEGQRFGEVLALRAPGHTPGHTIFQYRDVVFTGDLFQFTGSRFRVLPGFMTWDQAALRRSLSMLKGLTFEWLCPSHGKPVRNGPAVQAFLAQF